MSFVVDIKVVPRSGRIKWVLAGDDRLKCYLKSPPEKGKANRELVALLAKALGITQDKISIITGATSRNKRIKIEAEISFDVLLQALGIERQLKMF